MSYTVKAAALSRAHLGSLAQISRGELHITDMLSGVSHEADLIDERSAFDAVPRFALGRTETRLTFANAGSVLVHGESDVTISGQP